MSTVGSRLKEEMLRLGYNSSQFSEIAGVTKQAQYNYENDLRKPKTEYWEAIAKIGVDIHYIITGIHSQTRASASVSLSEEERGILERILKRILRIF